VYAASCEGSGLGEFVIKVPRAATAHVRAAYAAERSVLKHLASSGGAAGLLPLCIGSGVRSDAHVQWPLLVLRPAGTPLALWMQASGQQWMLATGQQAQEQGLLVGGGGGGSASAAAPPPTTALPLSSRMRIASAVAVRIVLALHAAHSKGIIHCDVRPANIVMVAGLAVLVDWGSATGTGSESRCHGVLAFSDRRVFEQSTYKARPAQDAMGLLYSWLAIAFGEGCCSPWGLMPRRAAGEGAEVSLEVLRESWLRKHRVLHREVAIVADAIECLSSKRSGALEAVTGVLRAIELC